MASPPHVRGYRLERKLGSGSSGDVFEAKVRKERRSLKVGQRVAVKILHAHLSENQEIRRAFKREAGIGMGIRHPNLSRVYELGTCGEGAQRRPYLVMSYHAGQTLRDVLGQRLPETFIRQVGAQIALALEALHARDIVHRDLKPENIFLDAKARVVVSDYGLSQLVKLQESGWNRGLFAGTLAYAAPERLSVTGRAGATNGMGEIPGPSSDLYSLGVILYEMASGKRPFEAQDVSSWIDSILHEKPDDLLAQRPTLSYFLEQVIGSLLDRDPNQRLRPASLVGQVLDQGEGSDWWRSYTQRSLADVDAGHRALAVDRPTRMYGRERELSVLLKAAREAFVNKRGRVVLIRGETGSGKSRLIDELSDAMEARGYRGFFLVGRPQSAERPLPYETVNSLIERALSLRSVAPQKRKEVLVQHLREWLGEEVESLPSTAAFLLGQDSEGWRVERALSLYLRLFRAFSEEYPGVLVFESLHRAGRGSLAVLRELIAHHQEWPVLIVATVRDEALRDGGIDDCRQLLDEIEGRHQTDDSAPTSQLLRLSRLGRDSIAGILRDLGVDASLVEPLVERLSRDGGSQPEYVIQVVQLLARDGQLKKAIEEGISVLDVPGNPLDLTYRRLFALTPLERQYLEASSLQGITFSPEATLACIGLSPMQGLEIQGSLESKHGLIQSTDSGARFSSHVSWKLIQQAIDPEWRRDYHRRLARELGRKAGPDLSGREAFQVARHAREGQDHESLREALLPTIDYLESRHQFEETIQWCRDGLLTLASDVDNEERTPFSKEQEIEVRLREASLLGRLGRRDDQEERLSEAWQWVLRESLPPSIKGRVQNAMAAYHLDRGRFMAALRAVDLAESLFEEGPHHSGTVVSLGIRASLYLQLDDLDEAREAVKRAQAWLPRLKSLPDSPEGADSRLEPSIRLELGKLLIATADLDRARQVLEDALREVKGYPEIEGPIRMHLARACRDLCLYAKAFSHARETTRIAGLQGDRLLEGRGHYLMGGIAFRAGHLQGVFGQFERALEIADAIDDRFSRVYVLADLGMARARRSPERDMGLALEHARRAVFEAKDLELGRETCLVHAALAMVYLKHGRPRWAEALSAKSMREISRTHAGWYRTAEVFWIRHQVLLALERIDEAEWVRQEGAKIVRERMARQDDPSARERMARRDPIHRALLSPGKGGGTKRGDS